MLNRQGRPTQAGEASHEEHLTFTGNKALQQIEPLIFEIGHHEATGVDIDKPAPFKSRLGKHARQGEIGLPGLSEPETMRDERRSRRQQMIGRRGRKQQQTDILTCKPGARNRHVARADREIGQRLIVGRVPPLVDSRAPLDPPGIEPETCFDFRVRNDALRRIMPKPDDLDAAHRRTSSATSKMAA